MKRNKKEDILLNTDNDDISMLAEIQTDPDEVTAMEFNKEIPVMPLRNMVMFPSVVMPVTIGRPSTLKLINAAYKKKLPIAVVCQIQGDMDDPGFNDVYHVGVIGKILRVFEMPGGNTTVIMQSNFREDESGYGFCNQELGQSGNFGKFHLCKLPYSGRRKDKIAKSWRFAKPPVYAGQDLKS